MDINFSKPQQITNGDQTISISKVIGLVAKPADQEKMLENTYNKHYNNPESEYYHLSKEEIKEIWENKGATSRHYGSLLDDYIGIRLTGQSSAKMEIFELDNDVDNDERLRGLINSFENFYDRLSQSGDMEFVTREQTIYYQIPETNCYVKGRFDALFKNKRTGKWVIIDWKSSKSIDTSNKYEKLLGPAKLLDNCNYNTYTIQGYFYKTALVNGGYLPEGTTEDDVEFLIVQLPGFIIESTNDNFKIWRPAFKYEKNFMDKLFDYAMKKNEIMINEKS